MSGIAFSYRRFSSKVQERGDSLRRQMTLAEAWCERNKVKLDTTLAPEAGTSAHKGEHRANPDRNSLALFLEMVERGQVPRGSYLVVEALDRLTREDIQPALMLILGLLQAGVRVVQLSPYEATYDDKSGPEKIMLMIVELMGAHSYSKKLSDRMGQVWGEKKKLAREQKRPMTKRMPAWIRLVDGEYQLIPERAATVKLIYQLAGTGYGIKSIIDHLKENNVPTFGGKHWSSSYIGNILRRRTALGEKQPGKGRGKHSKPEGPPIPGYFPAAVSEAEWLAARQGAKERKQKAGRLTETINIWQGLTKDARDGGGYFAPTAPARAGREERHRIFLPVSYIERRGEHNSFPVPTFEGGALRMLRMVPLSAVLPPDSAPDLKDHLERQQRDVEERKAKLKEQLRKAKLTALDAITEALNDLGQEEVEISAKLEEAKGKAAHPVSAAWTDFRAMTTPPVDKLRGPDGSPLYSTLHPWSDPHQLPEALAAQPDQKDARLRLRGVLRRMLESVYLLVTGRGNDRMCAAQFNFTGTSTFRTLIFLHRPCQAVGKGKGRHTRPGRWWVKMVPEIDLRNKDNVPQMLTMLEGLTPEDMTQGPSGHWYSEEIAPPQHDEAK